MKSSLKSLLLCLVFLSGCGSDKYDLWGEYYSTQKKIIDGLVDKNILDANTRSFKKLIEQGEIIEITWAKEDETKVNTSIANNGTQELRYGMAIHGGQWPVAVNGGGFGYYYKLDAEFLRRQIGRH